MSNERQKIIEGIKELTGGTVYDIDKETGKPIYNIDKVIEKNKKREEKCLELVKHDYPNLYTEITNLKSEIKENLNLELYDKLHDELDLSKSHVEYAKGGEVIHRGYYCPSLIKDMVVGGCERGKLLKRHPKSDNYNYKYLFNTKDQLVKIVNKATDDEEVIVYKHNELYSYIFNKKKKLKGISKCIYDFDRLLKYELLYISEFNTTIDYYREEYTKIADNTYKCKMYFNYPFSDSREYEIEYDRNSIKIKD